MKPAVNVSKKRLSDRKILLVLVIWLVLNSNEFAHAVGTIATMKDDARFGIICNNVLTYIEGGFGTLLAALAGLGAIVAAAAGGFRMAWSCLVVSIGAFILRNYMGMFFDGKCQ